MTFLRLVHSANTPSPNLFKRRTHSARCPLKLESGATDCPHWPPVLDTTSLANKLQWLALKHPMMLRVMEDTIDVLVAQDAIRGELREGTS